MKVKYCGVQSAVSPNVTSITISITLTLKGALIGATFEVTGCNICFCISAVTAYKQT